MPVVSIASNQIWLMILNKAIIQILQNENIKGKYSNFESEEDSDGKELKKPDTFEEISDHIKSNTIGKSSTIIEYKLNILPVYNPSPSDVGRENPKKEEESQTSIEEYELEDFDRLDSNFNNTENEEYDYLSRRFTTQDKDLKTIYNQIHKNQSIKGKRATLNIPLNEFNLDNMNMFQNVNKQRTIKFQDNKNLR